MVGILGFIKKGGFLMYPMIIICIGAFVLIIERWVFITKSINKNEKLSGDVLEKLESDSIKEAKAICENSDSSVSKVLLEGLNYYEMDEDIMEKIMDESILEEIPKSERFLPIIAVIASMLPMLGLLGTVAGMISLFDAISIGGTGDPNLFAGGISIALITTETGLMFALPIMFFHTIITYKSNKLIGEMEIEAKKLLNYKIVSTRGKNGKF